MFAFLEPFEKLLLQILDFFYRYVQNYGTAIILLTVLVRIIMLPLTIKQTKSMRALQKIQPKLKKLQEKYKGDKERLQKEMMKFYAEHKVNPLSGCLPLLLQMPIFIALFRMLISNEDLKRAGFLWIKSLGKPKPYSILGIKAIGDPILVGLMVVTTYLSQKMITADPQQEKMMLPMTLLMAFIALSLPSGVLLYWVTTNILTMIQQYFTVWLTESSEEGQQQTA